MTWHLPIYDAVLYSALGSLVLLTIASAGLVILRQPVRRVRLIEITLAALLVLPLLSLIPGYPRIALLPAPPSAAVIPPPRAIDVSPLPRPTPDVPPPAAVPSPAAISVLSVPSSSAVPRAAGVPPVPRAAAAASLPPAPAKSAWQLPRDVRFWIVTSYLFGVTAMLAWSLLGLVAIARLLRSAREAHDPLRAIFREIAGPASDRIALLVSPRAGQPCALLWRRPTIVLPRNLVDAGDSRQLRFALAHEWSHVARGDVWTWSLSSVVRWFYFYQPLLWHLRRQLRLCQDHLADFAAAGNASEDYAEFLTTYSSRLKHPSLAPGLGIAGRKSELHRRIVMLLDSHRPLERSAPRRWNLLAIPLAVVILAAVACVRAEPGNAPKADAAPQGKQSPMTYPRKAAAQAPASAPFSGRIRPGDKLNVELAGGWADRANQGSIPVTVESNGQLPLGAYYGRVNVGGKTLAEAEAAIVTHLREILKDPQVQVTYVGHDPDVVATDDPPVPHTPGSTEFPPPISALPEEARLPADEPLQPPPVSVATPPASAIITPAASVSPYLSLVTTAAPAVEPLQPLDTVEIRIPLKPQVHYEVVNGKTVEIYSGSMPDFNGIYVIEPGGEISLPHGFGRVQIKGMDARTASKAVRDRLTEKMLTRTALPSVRLMKRGRAIFPEGKEPPADYRIRKGDNLLIGTNPTASIFNYEVDSEGNLPPQMYQTVHVEGLTLPEAQEAVRKGWVQAKLVKPKSGFAMQGDHTNWFVTVGGWREEADPDVIDALDATDATRFQRLEHELLDLKNTIRELRSKP